MMLLLIALLLRLRGPRGGEERTRHSATDVDPEEPWVTRERSTEVRRVGCAAGRRSAVGAKTAELHTAAAVLVKHPQLPGARGDQILPVGRPDGRREVDPLALRDDVWLAAVGVCHPDVLRAVAIAHEDDLGSVGRVAGLLI